MILNLATTNNTDSSVPFDVPQGCYGSNSTELNYCCNQYQGIVNSSINWCASPNISNILPLEICLTRSMATNESVACKINSAGRKQPQFIISVLAGILLLALFTTSAGASPFGSKPNTNQPPVCAGGTSLVGDGNPHQNYLYQQVSENQSCANDAGCGVSRSMGTSISFTASAGFAGDWINGGFSVTKTFSNSDSYTCDGNPSETICVFYIIAHTAYTVNTIVSDNGGCKASQSMLQSPNDNNQGGMYTCMNGDACKNINYQYWDTCGPAGGPQPFGAC